MEGVEGRAPDHVSATVLSGRQIGLLKVRKGRVASSNSLARAMLGYTAAQLRGMDISLLFPDAALIVGRPGLVIARHSILHSIPVLLHITEGRGASDDEQEYRLQALPNDRHLQEALVRYQLLSEASRDIALFVGPGGQIIEANRAAEQAYGYTREELLQLRIFDLRAPQTQAEIGVQMARAAASGITFETVHQRKDGTLFPVEVSSTGGELHGKQVLLSLIRPVAARRLRNEVDLLLGEIDHAILQKQPLHQILALVCQRICHLFGFAVTWIGMKQPDGSVRAMARAGDDLPLLDEIQIRWDDSPFSAGPTGRAIQTGELQYVAIGPADDTLRLWLPSMLAHGIAYALALPLTSEGTTFGALTLYHRGPGPIVDDWIEPLQRFARHAAISILAAQDQEQLLLQKTALNAAANAVVITDRRGRILWVNPAWERLTGYSAEEVLGGTPRVLNSGRHGPEVYADLWQTILSGLTWSKTIWNKRKDGSLYLDEQTITPLRGVDGSVTHFIAIKQDVTERKQHEEQLLHLANHDPLTGLGNRRLVSVWIEHMVLQAQNGRPGAVFLMDMDRFKTINDTYGHPVGDELLICLAQIARSVLRQGDHLARMGGDEFAVLLPDVSLAEAHAIAERIRTAVDDYRFYPQGMPVSLSVSLGGTILDAGATPTRVLNEADQALFTAKHRGRNRITLYHADEQREVTVANAALWATRIKDALREERMHLHFQPIVGLANDLIRCYEVLTRMEDAEGNLVPSSTFLSAAEAFGLMDQVDRWVVRRALQRLKVLPGLHLFINLSAQSLNDDAVLSEIEREVRSSGVEPARLTFEITETAAVKDLFQTRQGMIRLNDLGCDFALDDFGTGFSSFRYLRDLPARFVKIDGFFIKNLDTDPANLSLVRALTSAAQEMGKIVIAEWVESPETARLLAQLGVDLGQGFHFGRPKPEPF